MIQNREGLSSAEIGSQWITRDGLVYERRENAWFFKIDNDWVQCSSWGSIPLSCNFPLERA